MEISISKNHILIDGKRPPKRLIELYYIMSQADTEFKKASDKFWKYYNAWSNIQYNVKTLSILQSLKDNHRERKVVFEKPKRPTGDIITEGFDKPNKKDKES